MRRRPVTDRRPKKVLLRVAMAVGRRRRYIDRRATADDPRNREVARRDRTVRRAYPAVLKRPRTSSARPVALRRRLYPRVGMTASREDLL